MKSAIVIVQRAQLVTLSDSTRAWFWDGAICRVGKRGPLPQETVTLDDSTWLRLWDGAICRLRTAGDPNPSDFLWTGNLREELSN